MHLGRVLYPPSIPKKIGSSEGIMLTKEEIRRDALRRREGLSRGTRLKFERLIESHIAEFPRFKWASIIALYAPTRGEVNILSLLNISDKVFVFPRVEGEYIKFYKVSSLEDLEKGKFGIMEPVGGEPVYPLDIGLVLVPGLAFDRSGFRIGYGKGYFDRLMREYPSMTTMGVCFKAFLFDALPRDPWDVRVSFVVTESGVYMTRGEGS